MPKKPRMITLLSDFGCDSVYVAQMKAVILRETPEVRLVDLSHSIEPQNILHGAIALSETVPFFASETIHLAVVDPGVGTERKLLALKLRWSRGNELHYVLAPDNGLASLLCDSAEEMEGVFLTNRKYWRCGDDSQAEISHTFHGRDILAPVAAALARGVPLEELGDKLTEIVTLDVPKSRVFADRIEGRILIADSFGNLMTNVVEPVFFETGREYRFETEHGVHRCRFVATYAHEAPGTCVLLFGSSSRLEIAIVNGSARERLHLEPGTDFVITAFLPHFSNAHSKKS